MGHEVDVINNDVFIGARALDEQVNLILPTYKLIIEQIKQIRDTAKNTQSSLINKRENNNTIGVFGARGTGKTSILYTIIKELESNNSNIILPIIEPDNFGENTKIMGSIVGLLSDAVDEELEEVNKQNEENELPEYFNKCIYKENNPLKSKRDELIEYHLYTESEYRILLTHNFDDTATHIKKSSYLLTPDIKFKEKLVNLIDMLIETRKKAKKLDNTPLIFIFIDDIDLKTTKCKELIDSILQYANHPNIVTILSGDYDILKESITLALINDENLIRSNLDPEFKINQNDTIIDRKKYLANEYLKKIIPPARRHNVVNWNITTIPKFRFGSITMATQLNELMGENNFFGYQMEGSDKIYPIKYSYSIFDKTPRGLINAYYHIYQIIKLKKEKEQNKELIFKNVKSLIDTIILSSRELVDEQQSFLEKCILWGNNAESTFIDYQQIFKYNEIFVDNKSKYKVHKNLFHFFIICEILKELLNEVSYNESDYIKLKDFILYIIYLDPQNKVSNNLYDSEKELKESNKLHYIGNIVYTIAQNTNLKSALILLEHLTNTKFKENYRYEKYNDDDKYEKSRNVFIAICRLIKQKSDENLLKNMYLKSYDNKGSNIDNVFRFLIDICTTTSKFSKYEKLFDTLIKDVFYDDNKSDDLMKMLFINTLIKIQELKYEEIKKIIDRLDEKDKYLKRYKIIKKFNETVENKEVNNRKRNNVNKIINELANDIREILFNTEMLNLKINDTKILNKGIDEFKDGYSGVSKTKYSYSQYILPDYKDGLEWYYNSYEVDCNKINYFYIFRMIENLATNTRVWYGRQEAVKFIAILKDQFYLDMNIFESFVPIIYELAIYLSENIQTIIEDTEYDEYKEYMQLQLSNAFKEANKEIKDELEEIGSSLEEDETIE